jgi:hypothetical protein
LLKPEYILLGVSSIVDGTIHIWYLRSQFRPRDLIVEMRTVIDAF